MTTYENMTIVQYDRGCMGEFISLALHKKIFGEDKFTEKRNNNLGWYFMNIDGTIDSFLYDYHRPNIESVVMQRSLFGTCVYEEMKAGNVAEVQRITHAMINFRKHVGNVSPENIVVYELPDPDYSYDSTEKVLTRIHNFDNIDLLEFFPGANVINVYSPPEKKWIFKYLFMYKKHKDGVVNQLQRFSEGVDEYWNFNWNKNLSYNSKYTNVNCYEYFLGNTVDPLDSSFASVLKDNYDENVAYLQANGLDYTRNNVGSDELLTIVRNIYSSYT